MLSSEVISVRDNGDSIWVYLKIVDGDKVIDLGDSYIEREPCIRMEFTMQPTESVQDFVDRATSEIDAKVDSLFSKLAHVGKHKQAFERLAKVLIGNTKRVS